MKHGILLLLVIGLFVLPGCLFPTPQEATLTVNPTSGPPSFRDGGLFVTFFVDSGTIRQIDYGDGERGPALTHLYTKVGVYTATVTIYDSGQTLYREATITVENDPCELRPPFIVNAPPQWRGKTILDGRWQLHGCLGDESGFFYGAHQRPWEELTYEWVVVFTGDTIDALTVYGEGPLVSWHVGVVDPPAFPDSLPVLTPTGTWYPSAYQPLDCDVDPWEDYAPGENIATATITLKVTNQFGSFAIVQREAQVYIGSYCR